jgi:hypothetical protein
MSIKSVRLRKERNRPPPDEPWVWFSREMLESEAWRLMPPTAKMVVFRICVEHMHHAGTENGNLAVTYDDFALYGIRRNSIRGAIAAAVGHGFTTITQAGRRSIGADRWPTRYALTWLGLKDGSPPTNRWKAWAAPKGHMPGDINSSNDSATRGNGRNPMGPSNETATGNSSKTILGNTENDTRENEFRRTPA